MSLCCMILGAQATSAASLTTNPGSTANSVVQQSTKQISGVVLDAAGIPIIGANVIVKGTTNGVITGIDGDFQLNVPENAILEISYIGYLKQEIPSKGVVYQSCYFDISNLGGGSYSINGVPVGMEGIDCVDLLKDIIHKAIETDGKAQDEIIDLIAFSLASAQAIPVGKTLSAEEMDHLLASLFLCPDIHLTPDGKTIYTLLTDDELAKRFG